MSGDHGYNCPLQLLLVPRYYPTWFDVQLLTNLDDPAAKYLSSRAAISDPRTRESTDLVCQWLKYCEEHHPLCQPPVTDLPTHCIDVGETGDVRLIHSKGQKSKYAVLSYCWGVATQPVLLKPDNIDSLSLNITLDSLPATIKEAILVTRALGICYLWVDALCIMQDGSEAAGTELRSMAKIYNNAAITISAACALSVEDGFLQPRTMGNDFDSDSVALPYWCADGTLGRIDTFYQAKYNGHEEPISKRAWILQEQLLSPRLVIYGKMAVVWECQTGQWNIEDLQRHKSTKNSKYDVGSGSETTFRINNALFKPSSNLSEPLILSRLRHES